MIKDSNIAAKNIDSLIKKHEDQLVVICEDYRQNVIIPFCLKNNYSFVSGGGGWFFWNETSNASVDECQLPKTLVNTLNKEVIYFCFGEYVKDFKNS